MPKQGANVPPPPIKFLNHSNMPIVNGTYQYDTLMSPRDAQNQVFGDYSKSSMGDYSTAAYNYLMKQQEQAYNLELWHLNNQYNSPASQMQRYQDAGLNPNLIYGQSNTANAASAGQSAQFRPNNTSLRGMQRGIEAVNQVMNTVKAARETYDYWMYGAKEHSWNVNDAFNRSALRHYQAESAQLEAIWTNYLMGSPDVADHSMTPRGRMYEYQMNAQAARIEQIRQLISASVSGQARTDALKELDDYRLRILQGQNDAVLNIHTGLGDSFDGFLKAMVYLAMSKL